MKLASCVFKALEEGSVPLYVQASVDKVKRWLYMVSAVGASCQVGGLHDNII